MAGVRLLLVVAVALLDDGDRVLVSRRPAGKTLAGLWELPGGKLEPGERPEDALVRELDEELGIGVDPGHLEPLTFASHTYPDSHLLMPLYACRSWSGEPQPLEGQMLRWVAADELSALPMPPADKPLIPALAGLLSATSRGSQI